MNSEIFKTVAVKTGTEFSDTALRPLQMFKGCLTMGTIRSHVSLLLVMLDAEVKNRAEIVKYSVANPDDIHLIGKHSPVQSSSLSSFIVRLCNVPEIAPIIDPRLPEYLDWFIDENRILTYHMNQISPEAFRSRWDWRNIQWTVRPKRAKPEKIEKRAALEYPFLQSKPSDDHALLMQVHEAVPKHIAPEIRSDLCQDLIVAVLMGEMNPANIRDEWPNYLKSCRKRYQDRWGTISIDYPVGGMDAPLKDFLEAK